ncbi:MAG: DUF1249 domain-containing protein [Hahellaceae bacterium]|nr:DUF1249 domain-containing protein [Hahellaceae bacterium]MCP5168656.1 DUF1249 domain-containing protein [Hahellaceae bacterium]
MVSLKSRRYVPDLQHLGALCDGNYLRLQKLCRGQDEQSMVQVTLFAGETYLGRIRISLLDQSRYTETFLLEQTHSMGPWLNNPKMTVRVYHDAGMAEVISCWRHQRIEAVNDYPNRYMHHPDEKVQLNEFLAEWLGYCLRFGCNDGVSFVSNG